MSPMTSRKAALAKKTIATKTTTTTESSKRPPKAAPVKLLSGGNPQIPKGDGDAPVQAYIAAMPGFKRDVGEWLDRLIERQVPRLKKAVKWNSAFYGTEEHGWFLATHCLTRYVKVTFFNGRSLHPLPPGGTPKSGESRWIDIHENDPRDDARMASWVEQAAALQGWRI